MSLTYHQQVDRPYTFGETSKQVTKSRLNHNFDILANNDQNIEDRFEDTFDSLFGGGIITGMEATIGTGLSIQVSEGKALIGCEISWPGGTVAVLANANPGYIFFCHDGTWHVDTDNTPPDDKSSFLYATYVSDASSVTSVTVVGKLVLPKLIEVSDTHEDLVVAGDYLDVHIDHSSQASFVIPGFIQLKVEPSDAFYVEHLYKGGITDDSDTEEDLSLIHI